MDGCERIVVEDSTMHIGLDDSGEYVILRYEKAVSWSALTPEQALETARQLRKWAEMARRIRDSHEQARRN